MMGHDWRSELKTCDTTSFPKKVFQPIFKIEGVTALFGLKSQLDICIDLISCILQQRQDNRIICCAMIVARGGH